MTTEISRITFTCDHCKEAYTIVQGALPACVITRMGDATPQVAVRIALPDNWTADHDGAVYCPNCRSRNAVLLFEDLLTTVSDLDEVATGYREEDLQEHFVEVRNTMLALLSKALKDETPQGEEA